MSLSIIIPTLNEARLIEHTLQGLKERAGDVEIVVVDGESTDETAALAGKYVRVIRGGTSHRRRYPALFARRYLARCRGDR